MATEALILDAIAGMYVNASGLEAVQQAIYSAGQRTTPVAGVKGLPDDISASLPALVIGMGDSEVITGSGMARQTWAVEGAIWAGIVPRDERYRELLGFMEAIAARTAGYGKGNLAVHADSAIQSVILTRFGTVAWRQWTRSPENTTWHLVLPWELEVKVNRPRTFGYL